MFNKIWIGLLSCLLLVLLVDKIVPTVQGQANPTLKKVKMGVVDFSKAAQKYKKYKKIEKRLTAKKKNIKKELQSIKEDVELLRKELKHFNPESRTFRKKERELAKKKAEFMFLLKKYREEFKKLSAKYTQEIVKDLEEAIAGYGAYKGFHIIFRKYLPINQAQMNIDFNTVVYHDKSIDITEDIIKTINAKFDRKKKNRKP